MRALSNNDFLEVWQGGARLHALDRALLALRAAFPETSYESLADWPLGRRNQALAELRCACFGTQREGWVACPGCGEKLELQMDARELAAPGYAAAATPVVFKDAAFRLPTSRDLAAAAREPDARSGAMRLIEACRIKPADRAAVPAWSDEDIDAVGEQMALADPSAETLLTLSCAACGNQWEESLDITDFLWAEVEGRARRLLFEVHTLATAYGWSESEILALSEIRRSSYLEMVEG